MQQKIHKIITNTSHNPNLIC